jgi:hypothetical protein
MFKVNPGSHLILLQVLRAYARDQRNYLNRSTTPVGGNGIYLLWESTTGATLDLRRQLNAINYSPGTLSSTWVWGL